jgi:hypothetical protein
MKEVMCLFFATQTVVVYVTAYAYDTTHMHEVMMYGKDFVELLNMMNLLNLLIEQVTKHAILPPGGGGVGMGTAAAGTDGDGDESHIGVRRVVQGVQVHPQPVAEKKNLRGVWLSQYEKNPIQLNYWLRSVADSNT